MLADMLDEVTKVDKTKGGMFSEPVPKDQFPDYYEVVKEPMDYGTMKLKLDNGDYRSAQQMQRDFVLVMQNCVKYNAPDSDIVKEARSQALSMPGLLRDVCFKNHLFLAEDGAVLEILSDSEEKEKKDPETKGKRGRKKGSKNKKTELEGDGSSSKTRRSRKRKAEEPDDEVDGNAARSDDEANGEDNGGQRKTKPRIRISLPKAKLSKTPKSARDDDDDDDDDDVPVAALARAKQKRKRRSSKGSNGDAEETPASITEEPVKKRGRKPKKAQEAEIEHKDELDLGTPVPRKKGKKMETVESKTEEKEESEPEDGEVKESTVKNNDDEEAATDATAAHLDKPQIREECEALDGSFQAARDFFTARGPWSLPATVSGDKSKEVAKILLSKIKKLDQYNLFAKPVTDDEAPGYSDVVTNPMDFRTIKEKTDRGEYGKGPDLVEGLYSDILLVMDNCALYNEEGSDVAKEAARIIALLPETFASACIAVSSSGEGKGGKKKRG